MRVNRKHELVLVRLTTLRHHAQLTETLQIRHLDLARGRLKDAKTAMREEKQEGREEGEGKEGRI